MRSIRMVGFGLLSSIFVLTAAFLLSGTASAAAPQPYPTASTSAAPTSAPTVVSTSTAADPGTKASSSNVNVGAGPNGSDPGSHSGLSSTGVAVFGITGLGLVLLVGGGLLMFGGRRPARS